MDLSRRGDAKFVIQITRNPSYEGDREKVRKQKVVACQALNPVVNLTPEVNSPSKPCHSIACTEYTEKNYDGEVREGRLIVSKRCCHGD